MTPMVTTRARTGQSWISSVIFGASIKRASSA